MGRCESWCFDSRPPGGRRQSARGRARQEMAHAVVWRAKGHSVARTGGGRVVSPRAPRSSPRCRNVHRKGPAPRRGDKPAMGVRKPATNRLSPFCLGVFNEETEKGPYGDPVAAGVVARIIGGMPVQKAPEASQ